MVLGPDHEVSVQNFPFFKSQLVSSTIGMVSHVIRGITHPFFAKTAEELLLLVYQIDLLSKLFVFLLEFFICGSVDVYVVIVELSDLLCEFRYVFVHLLDLYPIC